MVVVAELRHGKDVMDWTCDTSGVKTCLLIAWALLSTLLLLSRLKDPWKPKQGVHAKFLYM